MNICQISQCKISVIEHQQSQTSLHKVGQILSILVTIIADLINIFHKNIKISQEIHHKLIYFILKGQ